MSDSQRERVRKVVEQVLGDLESEGRIPATASPKTVPAPSPDAPSQGAAPAPALRRRGIVPPEPAAEKKIAIGADHGGFELKRVLMELLEEQGYTAVDCGTWSKDSCDYPDFARRVGEEVRGGRCRLGIMIDGAGIGSAMALNKMPGIRAATVHSEATAVNSREHNNANVLVLGSLQMHSGHARRITRIWLATPFAGGRHARRVAMIDALDAEREGKKA